MVSDRVERAPPDPRLPDTSAKRTCHGSPSRLLHGERVRPPSEIRQERNGGMDGGRGGGVSCARPRTPGAPSQKRKKHNRGLFGKRGVVVPPPPPPPHAAAVRGCWREAAGVVCSSRGISHRWYIVRSIMNESCHRRCFAWLALCCPAFRECPVFPPSLSLLFFRVCIAVVVMCVNGGVIYFAMPGTCLDAYSLDTFDSVGQSWSALMSGLYRERVHVT